MVRFWLKASFDFGIEIDRTEGRTGEKHRRTCQRRSSPALLARTNALMRPFGAPSTEAIGPYHAILPPCRNTALFAIRLALARSCVIVRIAALRRF
jgi:hypothetical protein